MEFEDWNQIKSKEELKEMLKQYKKVLSKETTEYLSSIIGLETSVLDSRNHIEDIEVLNQLYLYRRAAAYNIYKRAERLLNNNKEQYNLEIKKETEEIPDFYKDSIEKNQGLYASSIVEDKEIKIFGFDCSRYLSNEKNMYQYIGDINLYLTEYKPELREQELLKIASYYKKEVEEYEAFKADRPYKEEISEPEFTRAYNFAEFVKEDTIKYLEKQMKKLSIGKTEEPDEFMKKKIEIQKYYYDLLIKDFGIDENEFIKENNKYIRPKTLVRKHPGITVTKHDNIIF